MCDTTVMASEALHYALLGLISSSRQGIHGYRLKQEFDAVYGEFWALNYGQVYRLLDRLERSGLVQSRDEIQTGRPSRKVFSLTSGGQSDLEGWLVRPPGSSSIPLRDELIIKLQFLTAARVPEVLAVVRSQRAAYLQHLSQLTKRRTKLVGRGDEGFVIDLLLRQIEMRVRSDLHWLDVVEKAVEERFGIRAAERPR